MLKLISTACKELPKPQVPSEQWREHGVHHAVPSVVMQNVSGNLIACVEALTAVVAHPWPRHTGPPPRRRRSRHIEAVARGAALLDPGN